MQLVAVQGDRVQETQELEETFLLFIHVLVSILVYSDRQES